MNETNFYTYNLGRAFSNIVQMHGNKVALRYGADDEVTYATIDRTSGKVASWLLKKGVLCGDVVAIFHDKTYMPYAIMMACLKIGAVYTNVDTTSPAMRIKKIIDTAKPTLVFYSEKHRNCVEELYHLMADKWDSYNYSDPLFSANIESLREYDGRNCVPGNTPAYLMFTSGSTGYPKGAVISHQNVLNFISWGQQEVGCTHDEVVTNINPMHFDNSVFDFYLSLFTGATLVPISEELAKNPRHMVKHIEKNECTIWFSVPSMLVYALRMRALGSEDIPTMKKLVFGGEGFPKNHLRALHKLLGSRVDLLNVYGPTECTCICSLYRVQENDLNDDELLPLGPMAPNFYGLVVDANMHPVDPNQIGELLIGGTNVGLGYYRETEKTASAFIQNPTHNNYCDIVYRSGDLVRWDENRRVFLFAGRKGNQIKRMGYRIELEEIEAALNVIDGIEEAACVCAGSQDSVKICACVVSSLDENTLSLGLRSLIPAFMMPNEFRFYKTLPKNQNGKIDRVVLKQEVI